MMKSPLGPTAGRPRSCSLGMKLLTWKIPPAAICASAADANPNARPAASITLRIRVLPRALPSLLSHDCPRRHGRRVIILTRAAKCQRATSSAGCAAGCDRAARWIGYECAQGRTRTDTSFRSRHFKCRVAASFTTRASSAIAAPVSRLEAMAIGAQHSQIFKAIIPRIAIDVIELQRQPPVVADPRPTALFAVGGFELSFNQLLLQMARADITIRREQFLKRLSGGPRNLQSPVPRMGARKMIRRQP